MNISDQFKENEEPKTLHEQRYAEMQQKSLESKLGPMQSEEAASKNLFGTAGKDLKIKPLVYYNIQDCLKNVMTETDFVDKAKKNIGIIKANREPKGQRLCVKADIKDCLGQYPEGKRNIKAGFEPLAFHTIIREWLGYLCMFEIKQQPVGFGQTKRMGYTIEKVCVLYYGKNGIKICKEEILKIAFWMWNHTAGNENTKK